MVTINESDDSYEKKNIIINDRIYLLFNRYKQKQIRKIEVKKKLISYAKSSGFINNIYRKQAWSLIVDSPNYQYSTGK
jgi:hypothetical protein